MCSFFLSVAKSEHNNLHHHDGRLDRLGLEVEHWTQGGLQCHVMQCQCSAVDINSTRIVVCTVMGIGTGEAIVTARVERILRMAKRGVIL